MHAQIESASLCSPSHTHCPHTHEKYQHQDTDTFISKATKNRKADETYTTMPVQDLLYPSKASEAQKHKLKRLVQGPNSYFMDVKCPGCYNIQTVFSHVHAPVFCSSCSIQIAQPTGGKSRLTEGCSFRKKFD